jgi:filamentous hemagglutinin
MVFGIVPDPAAGLNYLPAKLDDANPNIANSHINGYTAELRLANEVAGLPNQAVVKYGGVVGTHGADVVSVNTKTGEVTLWDSKFRSRNSTIDQSPTFDNEKALRYALLDARKAIQSAKLPEPVRAVALQNLLQGNYKTNTVGAGQVRNSVPTKVCNHGDC